MTTSRFMSKSRPTIVGLLVGLGAGGTVAASLGASAVAAASTVAAVVTTTGRTAYPVTNIRSGPSTSFASVKQVPSGTVVTGTETNGWIKITSPSTLAGRFIAVSTLTVTARSTSTTTPAPSTPQPGTLKTPFGCNTRPVFQLNGTGQCVKAAQYVLNSWIMRTNPSGAQLLTVTGTFGTVTATDLKLFQAANRISATGIIDAATWRALEAASSSTSAITSDGIPAATGQTHNAFPTAIRLTDGRLMVVFRAAAQHLPYHANPAMYKMYSSDGGYTWTTPVKLTFPNGLVNTVAGLGIATSGPLKGHPILTTWSVKFDPATGSPTGTTHTYVTAANDLVGNSWGPLTDVKAVGDSNFSASPIVQVDDTNFTQAVYVYGTNTSDAQTVPLTWNGTQFLAGTAAKIAVGNSVEAGVRYNESDITKLPDGRLLALVRDDTKDRQGYIWKSYSSDGGKTWSTPTRAFAGTAVPRTALMKDGRLVVIYRHLTGSSAGANTSGQSDAVYRVSADNGMSWSNESAVGQHSTHEMSYGEPMVNADGSITFIYGSESSGTVSNILVDPNRSL